MKEQFQEWLENPATQLLNKYLLDSASEEANIIAETISDGGIIEINEQVSVSATCATLRRIAEISFEEIEEFYRKE